MIIAVDFDGTLCESRWPEIGPARDAVIIHLRLRREQGDKLILWTCREGQLLTEAVRWCMDRGLKFDAINDNLQERKDQYGNNCRKVSADEYWDDRSVIVLPGDGKKAEVITPEMDMTISVRKPNRLRDGISKLLKIE